MADKNFKVKNGLTIEGGATDTSVTADGSGGVSIGGVTAATISGSQTLTNKTISLANNTVSGTLSQFNTAVTDADFATLAGTETLSNKTLSNPTVTGTLTAGGGVGTNGQFLQSTATGIQWASVSGYSAPTLGSTSIASGATVSNVNGLTINSTTIPSSATLLTSGGALGTPSSGTLTNATGLPVSTGISGLGSGVATFLATPSSANLAAAVTGETGTGALVFGTSPTISTPTLTLRTGSLNQNTGDIAFNAATGQLEFYGFDFKTVVDTNTSQTLSNKTLYGANLSSYLMVNGNQGSVGQAVGIDVTGGIGWITPGGSAMTLLSTTSLSGSNVVISGINSTYTELVLVATNVQVSPSGSVTINLNDVTTGTYGIYGSGWTGNTTTARMSNYENVAIKVPGDVFMDSGGQAFFTLRIPRYATSDSWKTWSYAGSVFHGAQVAFRGMLGAGGTNLSGAAVSSISFKTTQSFSSGTVYIYGIK